MGRAWRNSTVVSITAPLTGWRWLAGTVIIGATGLVVPGLSSKYGRLTVMLTRSMTTMTAAMTPRIHVRARRGSGASSAGGASAGGASKVAIGSIQLGAAGARD